MTARQLLLTASIALIPAAFGQTTTAASTRTFHFQPIGLGATETAEVILHNSAGNTSSGTAASCTGSVTFTSSTGTAIGGATAFTLTAGQVTTVKLPFASSGGSGVRTVIIPSVSATFTSGTPCSLSFSLDTYDTSSGATHAVAGGEGSLGNGGR